MRSTTQLYGLHGQRRDRSALQKFLAGLVFGAGFVLGLLGLVGGRH